MPRQCNGYHTSLELARNVESKNPTVSIFPISFGWSLGIYARVVSKVISGRGLTLEMFEMKF